MTDAVNDNNTAPAAMTGNAGAQADGEDALVSVRRIYSPEMKREYLTKADEAAKNATETIRLNKEALKIMEEITANITEIVKNRRLIGSVLRQCGAYEEMTDEDRKQIDQYDSDEYENKEHEVTDLHKQTAQNSISLASNILKSVDSVTQMMNSGGQLADAVMNAIDAGEADDLALQTLDELKEAGKQFSNLNVLLDISRGYLTQAGKDLEQSKKVLAGAQRLNDSVKNQLREFKIVVITYEIGNTSDEIERLREELRKQEAKLAEQERELKQLESEHGTDANTLIANTLARKNKPKKRRKKRK
jgi:septal ring factor EnvC (AmiA/AmiB activator)